MSEEGGGSEYRLVIGGGGWTMYNCQGSSPSVGSCITVSEKGPFFFRMTAVLEAKVRFTCLVGRVDASSPLGYVAQDQKCFVPASGMRCMLMGGRHGALYQLPLGGCAEKVAAPGDYAILVEVRRGARG